MKSDVQKNLDSLLDSDETVEWRSATQPFGITEGSEGGRVRLQWILSTAGIVGFIALVFAYGIPKPSTIAMLLILLAVLILAPVVSYRDIRAQEYVITNKRVLIVKPKMGAFAIRRSDLDGCRLFSLAQGGQALAIGASLLPEGQKQLRWRSLHPKLGRYAKSDEGLTYAEGLVFYKIKDGEKAEKLLSRAA